MSDVFNREMLQLARETRGWTQGELAANSGVTQGYISMLEQGQKDPSDDKLGRLASALRFPESFFQQPDRYTGFGITLVFHRKKSSTRVGHLRQLQAQVNLRRIHILRLLGAVDIHAPNEFVRMDIDDHDGDAEKIASFVRANWRLPIGPITNLVRAIEDAGGVVFSFSFGTRDIDAISQWPDDGPPLFFINTEIPADRARFSLAYELGHVLMHRSASDEMEAEADRFASALLMPEDAIGPHLAGMSIKKAASMKPYWRVSMQALIRRARDLGKIDEFEYRRLFRRLTSLGYRRKEPITIPPEEPRLFGQILAGYQASNRFGLGDTASVLSMHEDEFISMYLAPDHALRITKS